MRKCAIFAGGDMPDLEEYRDAAFWQRYSYYICADCGYRHAMKLGVIPDMIVGDFDSYGEELPIGVEVLRSVPEKDDTDTLMAVKKAIELGYTNIDPLKSKEHILLSNIIESYWTLGKDVTLVDLINAVNDPPFDTLQHADRAPAGCSYGRLRQSPPVRDEQRLHRRVLGTHGQSAPDDGDHHNIKGPPAL